MRIICYTIITVKETNIQLIGGKNIMKRNYNDYYETKRTYKLYCRPNVAYAYDEYLGLRKCTRNEIDKEIKILTDDNPSYTFYALNVR